MNARELELYLRRNFDNVAALVGIIPFLVFVYLLDIQIGTANILASRVGLVLFISMIIAVLGIFAGQKVVATTTAQVYAYERQLQRMQNEMIEKKRLEAISETVIAIKHEINNPLGVVSGHLELMEDEINSPAVPEHIKKRFVTIRNHCDRITKATSKLSTISKPAMTKAYGNVNMLDLDKSS